MTSEEIAAGLLEFLPVPGRCRAVPVGEWTLIDDTYNASPASMAAACEMLREWQGASRRILITGDMLELGADSKAYHENLGRQAAAAGLDGLISLGSHATDVLRAARDRRGWQVDAWPNAMGMRSPKCCSIAGSTRGRSSS